MLARVGAAIVTALLIAGCSQQQPASTVDPTPPNTTLGVYGKVTDAATGAPLKDVCVTLGIPGSRCWGTTDAEGNYAVDMINPWSASPGQFAVYFTLKGYKTENAPARYVTGTLRIDFAMHRQG